MARTALGAVGEAASARVSCGQPPPPAIARLRSCPSMPSALALDAPWFASPRLRGLLDREATGTSAENAPSSKPSASCRPRASPESAQIEIESAEEPAEEPDEIESAESSPPRSAELRLPSRSPCSPRGPCGPCVLCRACSRRLVRESEGAKGEGWGWG